MPNRSAQYWKKRFELLEEAQNQQGVQCYAELEKQYRKAQRQLEAQIQAWYSRFAANNGVTLADARKMLSDKELAELKWDINEYIRYGKENAISGTWVKELENASSRFHISRLEALKLQTQQQIEVLFGNQLDTIDTAMRGIYKSGYYHTAFEIQKGLGVGWDFATLDEKTISKVINKPWAVDGKNFSERVWGNRSKLVNELNNTLTQNIILGKDPQKAIDEIARKMNTSKTAAGRLVMTEEAFFSSAAQKDCFSELDVEQYEIVATLDSHTSDICQGMDGKHFKMSEWVVGATAPPFHVWCRTTTVPYFGDEFDLIGERAARGEDGKTYHVPGNMTYKDWEKSFVDGNKSDLKEISEKGVTESGITNKKTPKVDEYRINRTVIESNDYKRRFNGITGDAVVDESIHRYAKAALYHRDGTNREDLYIISNSTGEILGKNITSTESFGVSINDSVRNAVRHNQGDLIGLHTHFDDTPPTGSDFETAFKRRYNLGVVANATGDVYLYGCGDTYISAKLIDDTIEKYIKLVDKNGERVYTTTKEAHLQALNQLRKDYGIWYEKR